MALAIGLIPLTFIPLTFSCFSILHLPSSILVLVVGEPQRSIRVSSSEFEPIRANSSSRPHRGAMPPKPFLLNFCVLSRSFAAIKAPSRLQQ